MAVNYTEFANARKELQMVEILEMRKIQSRTNLFLLEIGKKSIDEIERFLAKSVSEILAEVEEGPQRRSLLRSAYSCTLHHYVEIDASEHSIVHILLALRVDMNFDIFHYASVFLISALHLRKRGKLDLLRPLYEEVHLKLIEYKTVEVVAQILALFGESTQ